jgi:hypothetical protein
MEKDDKNVIECNSETLEDHGFEEISEDFLAKWPHITWSISLRIFDQHHSAGSDRFIPLEDRGEGVQQDSFLIFVHNEPSHLRTR